MTASLFKDFVKNGRKIYGAAFNFKNPSGDTSKQVKEPVLFLKAPSDYVTEGRDILIPKGRVIMEEIELGVVIGRICKNVSVEEAMDYVGGYCVALDMTITDKMEKIRKEGWPWSMLKSFDTSCPVSGFIPKEEILDPNDVELFCSINGSVVQSGNTRDLVFSPAHLISYISQYHTLEPSDLILTGTPPVPTNIKDGDIIRGGIKDGVTVEFIARNSY
ncbi:hypothetical protein FQR65_LT05976 [Abscondita terminalis]|nr:hypothetical protein FQR65_LT05976 [Abscondita terminalis]